MSEDAADVREVRARLVRGEITPQQAAEMGFPPADPVEERR